MFYLLCTAIKFQQPQVLPPNYIPRHELLEELVSAVMSTELERNRLGSTVTITGVGGFGKSVLAIALCHHDIIKAKFSSGFVFVELRPKSFDPVVELHRLYYLLTGKEFPTSQSNNTNIIVNEIRQVTINHSDKLLVIIDDVWHFEDAEPIIEAFNNCKIIITTRENEISQRIPSKCRITAGPMEPHEAISLLIDGIILQTQLSKNDRTLLDNIAHDVHLSPLLLFLIRGQLSHYIAQHLPFNAAIKMIHQKLYVKGLTAFDKSNVGSNISKRKNAVKACIETTLDLLEKLDSFRMKVMTLLAGIGSALPTIAVHVIWKTSPLEAIDTMFTLWRHGLVTYSSIVIPRFGVEQRHIEVHAIISQFIIETIQTDEISLLTPHFDPNIAISFGRVVCEEFYSDYGLPDLTSINHEKYLIYQLGNFDYFVIPYLLRYINTRAVLDPYIFKSTFLELMLEMLTTCTSDYPNDIISSFSSQVSGLINNCQKIVIGICRSKKTLYQLSMKHLVEKNYDGILQELEDYRKQYPLGAIVERSVKLVDDFMVYCQDDHNLYSFCETLLTGINAFAGPSHPYNVMFPAIIMCVELCKRIDNSLKSKLHVEIKHIAENFEQILNKGMELIEKNYQICS